MNISLDLNSIFNTSIALLLALVIRMLLDLKVGVFSVKYLHFIPVRSIFRINPPIIKGQWEQIWDVESLNFPKKSKRKSSTKIKQLGNYCYCEFESEEKIYVLFGKIDREQLIGEWFDKNDVLGYSGSFHLIIKNGVQMDGLWIGNSKSIVQVKSGNWSWKKVN